MNLDNLWNNFALSGSIEMYLEYKGYLANTIVDNNTERGTDFYEYI